MRVFKFGGSSLANATLVLQSASIIEKYAKDEDVVVVLSALGKTTNKLIEIVESAVSFSSELPKAAIIKERELEEKVSALENYFWKISQGIKEQQPEVSLSVVEQNILDRFEILRKFLEGIKLLGMCPVHIKAQILSLGEKISVDYMKAILDVRAFKVNIVDPTKYLISKVEDEDSDYLDAHIDIEASTQKFKEQPLKSNVLNLVPGFFAGNSKGQIVCLGRNGSDYSAAVLAACLNARSCEIWTDVEGVYNCDPKLVKDAQIIQSMSYEEAMELSYFGAAVLHPKTVAPIAQFKIPCLIKNSFNPEGQGTLISENNEEIDLSIKGITTLENLVMMHISGPGMKGMRGMASRIFSTLSAADISPSLITQSSSEYSISFCINQTHKQKAIRALNKAFELELKEALLEPINFIDNVAIITLVGEGIRTSVGVASRFFASLAEANINVIAIATGSSERSVSAVILNDKASLAVKACHENLFNAKHYLDVFVVGVGGVGSALIEQIKRQQSMLAKRSIVIRVCGIANSKHMILNSEGLELEQWQSKLAVAKDSFSLDKVSELVQQNRIINPIIVDCTSSDEIAAEYVNYLMAGFHVVTPNKKANTASMKYYLELKEAARASRRKYLYEGTAGAGLPVIENLQNLMIAGDKLEKFSGILSGSLSYIFGKLDEGVSFSAATQQAKDNGFTEPDPRDDLSGLDVARKLLILAREVGLSIELEDVAIEPILPESFDSSGSVDSFMERLSETDTYIEKLVEQARQENKVLRYVGEINQGKCRVKIQAVDDSDPLFKIKDGENALAFYSLYYQPIPLVLRGYGAGNEVTAAGVFADVMRTLGYKIGA